jgi:D-alanyl-lipoteichoic acid acyltransferase DltB (MBOAT superfamily)
MLFNSIEFLFFFPIVTALYFWLPQRFRWFMLLAASCYFYMAFVPVYILILGGTIVIDYFAGIYIEKLSGKKRRWLLIISLISNIGVLAVFKYYNFLNGNLTALLGLAGHSNPIPFLKILLPIGLSFHTFQAMSYTIEVYRGNQKAERNFGIYALYVMFYPQLVAGPIERPQNMLHQFYEKHTFDYRRAVEGLRLMLWGLFKKMVIADRLAIYVNDIFDHPNEHHGIAVLVAAYFFAIQIYCDFSGYSDIARGAAQVMGFRLMLNFNLPYFATSVREFWSRWHISLSTWFRDYLYIPLGGNRVKEWRWMMNLFIVFVVSGLWHGASWTFIIWGALHGFYLVAEIFLNKIAFIRRTGKTTFGKAMGLLITFHLVVLGWIFFRANSFGDAILLLKNLLRFDQPANLYTSQDLVHLVFGGCFIGLLMLVEYFTRGNRVELAIGQRSAPARWSIYVSLVLLILWFGVFTENEFIYFQF